MINDQEPSSSYRPKPGDRVYRVPRQQPWQVFIPPVSPKTGPKVSLWTLVYGFAVIIVVGTILLVLPCASKSGTLTSPINAFFTATSSVCVTGLVVVDTLDYWSFFGQLVILVLIQLGGLGYMTMTTLILIVLGRRIGLKERLLIGESLGLSRIGGAVKLVRNIFLFTMGVEATGAIIFYTSLSVEYSGRIAVWKSVFQSVSAFNNAGFDLFGGFTSLTGYSNNPLMLLTTAILVILGGISFLVVADVFRTRKIDRLAVDTKMVLFITAILLVLGMLVVFIIEYRNPLTLGSMPLSNKLLNSFFQSVTSRTSGFSAINTGYMASYALFFTMLLMLIGGASGSAAGGIKVSTFGLIIATIWSTIRGKEHPGAFGREFVNAQIFRALAVLILTFGVVGIVTFILSITENFGFINILFETVSAFGTVGLSTGITPDLSTAGKIVIAVTMFIGRLGPLTLILALVRAQKPSIYRTPQEIIRIG